MQRAGETGKKIRYEADRSSITTCASRKGRPVCRGVPLALPVTNWERTLIRMTMPHSLLHGRPVATVFDLLGHDSAAEANRFPERCGSGAHRSVALRIRSDREQGPAIQVRRERRRLASTEHWSFACSGVVRLQKIPCWFRSRWTSPLPLLGMASSQLPSPRHFLVHGPRPLDEGGSLAGLDAGSTERGDDDRATVIEDASQDDPRATWSRLLDRFPDADWVSPLVLDEADEQHLPTGDVTVRFRQPPSDEELERFAGTHRLELRRRNEFVPVQASFRPRDLRRTYLPDLVTQLVAEGDVSKAWLNTRSRYRRA